MVETSVVLVQELSGMEFHLKFLKTIQLQGGPAIFPKLRWQCLFTSIYQYNTGWSKSLIGEDLIEQLSETLHLKTFRIGPSNNVFIVQKLFTLQLSTISINTNYFLSGQITMVRQLLYTWPNKSLKKEQHLTLILCSDLRESRWITTIIYFWIYWFSCVLDLQQLSTMPYHAMANGLVEPFNGIWK